MIADALMRRLRARAGQRVDDERRARERLYGPAEPGWIPAPVDIVAAEEPGSEALAVAGESPRARAGRLARSTAFFSFATSLSRIAGLVREIFAASYFGVSGAMSAFTIAFQVPNLVRSLFADAAIQAAFVPVFTEQLEQRQQARGVPARLDPDLPRHARPRRRSRRCSSSPPRS